MPPEGSRSAARSRAGAVAEVAALAALCYLPFLVSSPGRISSDSKQYLYLDPAGFLERALHLWDAQAGAGTVGHQYLGYLWPMGPWFALTDALGVPVWVSQRLWLGTLSFAAVLGARWLLRLLGVGRVAALAGAFVYLLTPYQLAFSARMSVLLLPWAGLPWLVGLAHRSVRRGGWRDPAWFALVVLCIGAVNASSLALVGIGPLVWIVAAAARHPDRFRRAAGSILRIGVLSAGVSLWWIASLRVGAAYGLPVLNVTELTPTIAEQSSPLDVLRGIGNWFFYGRDRFGYSIDQAAQYRTHGPTQFATYAIPVLGLASLLAIRWRHRVRAAALVLVGTVVAVGAWPPGDSSPYGRLWEAFADTAAGLALRNTPRAVPVLVLGIALAIAAAVSAIRPAGRQLAAAGVVAVIALAGLWPAWTGGFMSEGVSREPIPSYWLDAAADLDAAGSSTRVLEIPGSPFAAHRFGNAIDPILPGLMDRPQLSREVFPQGSPESALLIDALDRRMQEGTFEPASLAPIARLFGAGDVVLRSDLQFERYRTPRPKDLWRTLTEDPPPGLGDPEAYGDPVPNVPVPSLPMLDELALRLPADAEDPPPVARFPVEDAVPIVRTGAVGRPIVLAGDGDGVVDAAAAGLVDGRALLQYAADLDDDELEAALDEDADLVLTDTNRRRAQTWFFAVRDTRGETERAGETAPEPSGYDFRLDPFADAGDDSRTVAEHIGGTVEATGSGGASRPEDRAVHAIDGDLATSWRVGGADPTGHRLDITADEPVEIDELVFVQPQDGPRDRVLTEVAVSLDGEDPFTVELGEPSLTPDGQVVPLPDTRTVEDVSIELTAVSTPPFDPALANAVGFAEVGIGDLVVTETIRLPVDLLERTDGGDGHRLDVVLTRLRLDPGERGRDDAEPTLDRVVDLPSTRSFGLGGTLRIDPDAVDPRLDELLGTDLDGATATSSGHLRGDPNSRASRALDGDPATAWQSRFGPQEEQWLQIELPEPERLGPLTIELLTDGRHSEPTVLRVEAEGEVVGTVALEAGDSDAPRRRVELPVPDEPVRDLRIVVEEVRRRTPVVGDPNPAETLPVGIAELEADGLPVARDATTIDVPCTPLLEVDGEVVEVRPVGAADDARAGWELEPCDGDLALDAGRHRITSAAGEGIDVDRVVLSSDEDGAATEVGVLGTDRAESGASVEVVDEGADAFDLEVTTDGSPFWLVLGQSANEGWELDAGGLDAGPRTVVDGYANGWLIDPGEAGTYELQLRWAPQRIVWIAIAISLAAVTACIVLLVVARRRPLRGDDLDEVEAATLRDIGGEDLPAPTSTAVVAALAVALVTYVVATPLAAVLGGVATWAGLRWPGSWRGRLVAAPVLVIAARLLEEPALAWGAPAILLADVVVRWLAARAAATPTAPATTTGTPSPSR